MAIINGKIESKKVKVKAVVSSDVLQKMNDYCQWANIDDISFFIEEAACFIFAKDKEWKEHLRSVKRAKK